MTTSMRVQRRRLSQLRPSPYPLPCDWFHMKEEISKRPTKVIKNDWEDATCSVCMDFPHNAVLLLCSSHDKGCRPYMCGTSYRYSNCLDQFKKAYMKMENMGISLGAPNLPLSDKHSMPELTCPLCRGQVKGWTVVEPAREYLNMKKRSCMQDGCSFTGTYKELRKHVRSDHPSAKPRQVDPVLEEKWRTLEHEREREDVISTIRSSMPGSLVLGDYVIENGGFDSDEEWIIEGDGVNGGRGTLNNQSWFQFFMLLQAMGNNGSASFASRLRRSQRGYRAVLDSGGMDGAHASQIPSSVSDLPLLAISDDDINVDMEDDGDDEELPVVRLRRGADHIGRSVRHRRRRMTQGGRHGIGLT